MRGLWRPVVVGAVIVVAVFGLAKVQIFAPSASPVAPTAQGDPRHGETVFAATCAGCHGQGGVGGGPGPRLVGSGLTAAEVSERVEQGGGVMPAGLVSGQDEADVVAYVVSIGGS